MTANDDIADPNQTPDDGARADRNRRRNPPIIELSAEDVSVISTTTTGDPAPPFEPGVSPQAGAGESDAAATETPAGETAATPTEPPAGEPEPVTPPPQEPSADGGSGGDTPPPYAAAPQPVPPPARKGPGLVAIAVTAVIGAVIGGGVVLGGIAATDIGKVVGAAEKAAGNGHLAAALGERLKALEDKVTAEAARVPDQGRLGEISDLVAQERAAVSGLESHLSALAAEVQSLSAQVRDTGPLDNLKSEIAAVKDQLGSEQQRLALLEPLTARIGAVETTDADLSRRIGTLQATVDEVGRGLKAVAANSEAATAFALSSLQRAVEDGGSFTAELALLSGRVGSDVTKPLEEVAVNGVPTRTAVEAGFGKAEQAIIATTGKPASDSFIDRLIASARALVTIRPTGPIAGDDTVAVTSRLKAEVDGGELARAAATWQQLPADARAASQGWANVLLERVKTEQAVNALSDAVLKKLGTPVPAAAAAQGSE